MPIIAVTAIAMLESDWITIINEIVLKLVSTTAYTMEQITTIVYLYE